MKSEIRFHEGLKGSGVVVSVTYGQDRVIFDFGAPFRPNTNFYDGTVMRRKQNALKDAILLGETPAIDGVYRKEDLVCYDGTYFRNTLPANESDMNTGVLISHLHLDHMSNIQYLDEKIPVYMHKNAKELLTALYDIHEGTPHDNVIGVELYEEIKIGEITCIPYFSDHPCYGSVGYLILTPDMKIYYSGDIRYHGLQRERAFEEIQKLTKEKIDLLIIDGTSYSPSKFIHDAEKIEDLSKPNKDILEGMFLEAKIYEDVYEKLIESQTMGLFNIYHRDMQLIQALMDHTHKANREIVFEVETAYIINTVMKQNVTFYVPDTFVDETIVSKVRANNTELTYDSINQNKEKYFVQVSYKNIMSLHSLDCKQANYFHLFGEPFGKGNRATQIFEAMMERHEINLFGYSNVYSFNHAFPNHLSYVIGEIDPKTVVCVHSNVPEKLNPMNAVHVLPKQNIPYIYVDNTLIEK